MPSDVKTITSADISGLPQQGFDLTTKQGTQAARQSARKAAENIIKAKQQAQKKAKQQAQRKAMQQAQKKAKEQAQRKAMQQAQKKAKEQAQEKAKQKAPVRPAKPVLLVTKPQKPVRPTLEQLTFNQTPDIRQYTPQQQQPLTQPQTQQQTAKRLQQFLSQMNGPKRPLYSVSTKYNPNKNKSVIPNTNQYEQANFQQQSPYAQAPPTLPPRPAIDDVRLDNITTVTSEKSISLIKQGKPIYYFDLVKELKGGKSGDKVYVVKRLEGDKYKEYIFKLFKQEGGKTTNTEIDIHAAIYNTFKQAGDYIPIPKVLCYGRITDHIPFKNYDVPLHGMSQQFIVMEKLTFDDKGVLEFGEHISELCSGRRTRGITVEDDRDMIMQLFYFISTAITEGFSHCDLHTKNIMIIKDNTNVPVSMKFGKDTLPVSSNYRIKVIDFGEATRNPEECKKCRTLSAAIADLNTKCGVKGRLANISEILKGQFAKKQGSSCGFSVDLMFFVSILALLSKVENLFQLPIDIEKLTTIAGRKGITSEDLKQIYNELRLSLYLITPTGRQLDLTKLDEEYPQKIAKLLIRYEKEGKLTPKEMADLLRRYENEGKPTPKEMAKLTQKEMATIQPIIKARRQIWNNAMAAPAPPFIQMTPQQLQKNERLLQNIPKSLPSDPLGSRQNADRLRWYSLRDKRNQGKELSQQQVQQLARLQQRFIMTPQQANRFRGQKIPQLEKQQFYAYPAEKQQQIKKRTQMNPQQLKKMTQLLAKKSSSILGLSNSEQTQLNRLLRLNNLFEQMKVRQPIIASRLPPRGPPPLLPPTKSTRRQVIQQPVKGQQRIIYKSGTSSKQQQRKQPPVYSVPNKKPRIITDPQYAQALRTLQPQYAQLRGLNNIVGPTSPQQITSLLRKKFATKQQLSDQQQEKLRKSQQFNRLEILMEKPILTQQQKQQYNMVIMGPRSKQQRKQQSVITSKYPKCYTLGKDNSGIFCPSTEVLQALRLIPQAA